jgi:hypothetical protein
MDIALSMKYGGEVVYPSECDESTYKNLGLLCSSCHDVVYWMREIEREETPKRKGSLVKAHFKHFKGKDPVIVASCENRVSNLKPEDLKKQANKAIQQRAKLFQRWFWTVINNHIIRTDLSEDRIWDDVLFFKGEFSDHSLGKPLQLVLDSFKDEVNVSIQESEQLLIDYGQNSLLYAEACRNKSEENLLYKFFQDMNVLANSRLHRQIVKEAILFLANKRNREILQAIIVWMFISGEQKIDFLCNEHKNVAKLKSLLYKEIGKFLSFIPWAEEFDRVSKGTASPETSYAGHVYIYLQEGSLEQDETLI